MGRNESTKCAHFTDTIADTLQSNSKCEAETRVSGTHTDDDDASKVDRIEGDTPK